MSSDTKQPAEAKAAGAAPSGDQGRGRALAWIGGGVSFLVVVGIVALLRPGRHAGPAPTDDAAGSADFKADPVVASCEPACSRPAAGSRIAALVLADEAYDAGELSKARELYLDLLLRGGDLGAGRDVEGWAHGRLALCMARIARGRDDRVIGDPPLTFAEGAK
jgi:hypothetical protein